MSGDKLIRTPCIEICHDVILGGKKEGEESIEIFKNVNEIENCIQSGESKLITASLNTDREHNRKKSSRGAFKD